MALRQGKESEAQPVELLAREPAVPVCVHRGEDVRDVTIEFDGIDAAVSIAFDDPEDRPRRPVDLPTVTSPYPGTLQRMIPFVRQKSRSTWSNPVERVATILSLGNRRSMSAPRSDPVRVETISASVWAIVRPVRGSGTDVTS